jgi:hypothetical protein
MSHFSQSKPIVPSKFRPVPHQMMLKKVDEMPHSCLLWAPKLARHGQFQRVSISHDKDVVDVLGNNPFKSIQYLSEELSQHILSQTPSII